MSFFHLKKQEEKLNEEKFDQALKWDFEKDLEDNNFDLDDREFTPFIDLTNNLLKRSSFLKKNSSGLYRQLTIESAKNKIIRSKTAATLKIKDSEVIEVVDDKGNILRINKNILEKAKRESKKNNYLEGDISDHFIFVDTDGISKKVNLKDSSYGKNDLNESTDMIDYKNLYCDNKNEDSLDNECLNNYEDSIKNNLHQTPFKNDYIREKAETLLKENNKYLLCRFFKNNLYVSRNYIRCFLNNNQLNNYQMNNEKLISSNLSELINNPNGEKFNMLSQLKFEFDKNIETNNPLNLNFANDEFLPVKMKSGNKNLRFLDNFKANNNIFMTEMKNTSIEDDLYLDEMIANNKYILEIDLSLDDIVCNIMKYDQAGKILDYKKLLKGETKSINEKEFCQVINQSLNVISTIEGNILNSDGIGCDKSIDQFIKRSFIEKYDFLIDFKFLIYYGKSVNL